MLSSNEAHSTLVPSNLLNQRNKGLTKSDSPVQVEFSICPVNTGYNNPIGGSQLSMFRP